MRRARGLVSLLPGCYIGGGSWRKVAESPRERGLFFSSRRRHTRFDCEWSSDVCSSDLPGISEPLRLPHESGALKLLQRVRDESHRFANTYNAKLRLKRISESLLDEFPGIGQRRKAALLKKFGSIQRLRLATLEQIAAVPGFGGKAAGELKAFLEARSVRSEVHPTSPPNEPAGISDNT